MLLTQPKGTCVPWVHAASPHWLHDQGIFAIRFFFLPSVFRVPWVHAASPHWLHDQGIFAIRFFFAFGFQSQP